MAAFATRPPAASCAGAADGEVVLHPDEAVTAVVRAVFTRFAEFGSARRDWLWFRSEGLTFPAQTHGHAPIGWVAPTYTAIHAVLSNPVYAGAYAYGKTRRERFVDAEGNTQRRTRLLSRDEWSVLIKEHHKGYIDWSTFEANQSRLGSKRTRRPTRLEAR
jgi:hypothetical protein